MAFETGTATDTNDLMTKLNTFAVANGWTSNEFSTVTQRLALQKNSCYVNVRWLGTGNQVAMSQSIGWTSAATPINAQPDDSGGEVSVTGTVLDGKRLFIGNSPFVNYWFFEDDAGGIFYIHVVVEYDADTFTGMSFGILDKFGTWTGGEFLTASYLPSGYPSGTGALGDRFNMTIFDGAMFIGNAENAHTMRIEGLPGMDAASKWGVFHADHTDTLDPDRAGNPRYHIWGGLRGGIYEPTLAFVPSSNGGAFTPLRPVPILYISTALANPRAYLLGYVPDLRSLNISSFVPGLEVNLGGDVWIPFPQVRKRWQPGNSIPQSGNAGYAIKKVV